MSANGSDVNDVEENVVFYRDREEWLDVKPLPHNEDENAIDVYDYFRAVLVSGEKSQRVLELTKDAVLLNPANYTAWQYRREVLIAMKSDLKEELEFSEQSILESPKNYQVWHHRRVLVERLNDPSLELDFTERVLVQDSKNYHAWQHRQWVIKAFKLFDNELEYTEFLIDSDIRNNSAWNQRFFVFKYTTGFTEDVILNEFKFICRKIHLVKDNESAWNYFRGILYVSEKNITEREYVKEFIENLYESNCRSPFLLNFIIEMCEEHLLVNITNDKRYTSKRAEQLCYDLANEYDTIRSKYWQFLAKKFKN